MNRSLFLNARVLFIREGCPHCRLWLEFIERINTNLPINKRIQVIDCAPYDYYGIITHPLIRKYKDYFDSYPTLFLGHEKRSGSHTRVEIESFIKSRLINEFIFPYDMSIILNGQVSDLRFEKECRYEKGWFKKKVVCNG